MAFACPRCAAALADDASCSGCGARHPRPGGIPCLLHDAAQVRDRFAARFSDALRESEGQLAAIADELATGQHGAATRARLQAFAAGVRTSAGGFARIAAAAGLVGAPCSSDDDLVPSVAGHGALFEHYEYVFRDWGWAADAEPEHELALARVAEAAGDQPSPRLLVLGAGAGRLAYDLHHRLGARTTVALDIQPLLVLVAQHMFRGDRLTMAEFAADHLVGDDAVTVRELAAPAPARAGLELAFGDATRAPVLPGSFDLVVTPWFLDQLACDVRDVLPGIHSALADGGRWVFHGPLLHPRGKPLARCITEPELLELLPAAGFELAASRRDVLPYLRAPEGSARSEPVLSLAACKRAGARFGLPPWLRGLALPIPRAELPRRAADPVATAISTLVDGERSVLAIAGLLARRGGIDRRIALDATIAGLHALLRAA